MRQVACGRWQVTERKLEDVDDTFLMQQKMPSVNLNTLTHLSLPKKEEN